MVKNSCKDYDMTNGKCTSCKDELMLADGDCLVRPQIPLQPQPNLPGGAIAIITPNTQPATSNTNSGSASGTTTTINVFQPPQPPTTGSTSSKDPNCLKTESNKCIQCSNRFFLSPDGLCVPVNPLCDNYNQNGGCTSCYKGYKVSG
jgi:hypothetical protein